MQASHLHCHCQVYEVVRNRIVLVLFANLGVSLFAGLICNLIVAMAHLYLVHQNYLTAAVPTPHHLGMELPPQGHCLHFLLRALKINNKLAKCLVFDRRINLVHPSSILPASAD